MIERPGKAKTHVKGKHLPKDHAFKTGPSL